MHVSTPRGGRSRAGIIFHRGTDLERHRRVHRLIPVTSVERSLLDYAASVTPWELRKAFEAADGRDLIDARGLLELCGRGRAGSARLAALARTCVPGLITASPLERDFLRFCRRRRIPIPLTNETVEGFVVDCYWPDHRLVVELDGYASHRSREQFERDRRRDSTLQLAGVRVFRVTANRLHRNPDGLEAELHGAMAAP